MTPLLVIAAAALQVAAGGSDVIVNGRRAVPMREAARQAAAILPDQPMAEPFARFTDPVCAGVVGLDRASGQAVVDRIGAIAAGAGLRVGEPGCAANLLVIVAADSRAVVRRTLDRSAGALRAQSLASYRRILGEPGRARGWTETEVRGRDGERLQFDDGGPPTLSVPVASRVRTGYRRDIVSAVVVIDTDAARGAATRQIADYAAMRALTGAIPGRRGQGETILSAFGGPSPATGAVPGELTATDRAILDGLYAGAGNVAAGPKRAEIARRIVEARD